MDNKKDIELLLELIARPAFCVRDGVICHRNQSAQQLFIQQGAPIATLLGEDNDEYQAFREGSLYLTLRLDGPALGASVTRMEDFDMFVVDPESDQAELKTMALAALQLREPLSDATAIIHCSPLTDPNYAGQLEQRLFQLQRLICNMSDAARYASTPVSRMRYTDLCSFCGELMEKIEALCSDCDICFAWSCPPEPILTSVCEEKLERAIYNMISNAVKATRPGGKIEVKLSRRGQRAYLAVRDYGPGIPEELMSTVFSRFRRAPGLDSRREGLGLGLSLICFAATAHGGTVLIDRPENSGTRITMSLSLRSEGDLDPTLRSDVLRVDYAGERDHALLELSDALPSEVYRR